VRDEELCEWRPLACRTPGPPARIGTTGLPPCPLCFGVAPADEIERCRALPDREGRAATPLTELEGRLGVHGETTIA
jgi:hypothetical protein